MKSIAYVETGMQMVVGEEHDGRPLVVTVHGTARLLDLAGADAEFEQFRRVPTHLPGMLTRDEIVAHYCERMGLSVTPEQWRFYEVFGLFRLAVIAQQIYYRYHHGQTTNEAFAGFLPVVQYLEQRCTALVDAASGPAA